MGDLATASIEGAKKREWEGDVTVIMGVKNCTLQNFMQTCPPCGFFLEKWHRAGPAVSKILKQKQTKDNLAFLY